MLDADQLIARLGLVAHPEGGHYRQTFRDDDSAGRPASTAIYYLLKEGERSHWHKVDAVEVWHFYAGDPLELSLSADGNECRRIVLGPDLAAGQVPQIIVARDEWQAARPLGAFTLVGCTVAPGFDFAGFTLAPPGWEPGG